MEISLYLFIDIYKNYHSIITAKAPIPSSIYDRTFRTTYLFSVFDIPGPSIPFAWNIDSPIKVCRHDS